MIVAPVLMRHEDGVTICEWTGGIVQALVKPRSGSIDSDADIRNMWGRIMNAAEPMRHGVLE